MYDVKKLPDDFIISFANNPRYYSIELISKAFDLGAINVFEVYCSLNTIDTKLANKFLENVNEMGCLNE